MKRILLLYFILNSTISFSQRKYAADKYFNELAYTKAAKLYENLYKKGDTSQLIISRLGDSYYFISKTEEAEKWYKLLVDKFENSLTQKHIFRYAQVLKNNGKNKESDTWLLKLNKLDDTDTRGLELEKNKDYFINYTNKKKKFISINNLSLNTKYSDFGGFIYNKQLFFASTKPTRNKTELYEWNNQPYLNIYSVEEKEYKKNKEIEVKNVKKISSVNTRYHESNPVITTDGLTMYFTRDNFNGEKLKGDKNSVSHLKIFKAELVNGIWSNIKELPFNNDGYSCGHPAVSIDGKTLYFVSDMPKGFGATDIYKVQIKDDNTFSSPENLGPTINTEGNEMFPYIGGDNFLYFASNGHLGLGGLDVFESKIDSLENYSKVNNVGVPINSALDDFGFVINNKKTHGYFSSNRKGGKGDDDIYSFIVYNCKEAVVGIITDSKTNKPISSVLVKLINDKGVLVNEQLTSVEGSYSFLNLDCESNFVITTLKDNYRTEKQLVATKNSDKETIKLNFELVSLVKKDPVILENKIAINSIYFNSGKFNVREDAKPELEHVISIMKKHPTMVIKIESHTDARGSKRYNKRLSNKRAKSMKKYIISRGILPQRIESAIGYGEDQLLNNCGDKNLTKCSNNQHQENRRSYFYIVKR